MLQVAVLIVSLSRIRDYVYVEQNRTEQSWQDGCAQKT